jgi:hypothetical protein
VGSSGGVGSGAQLAATVPVSDEQITGGRGRGLSKESYGIGFG